MHSFFFNFFKWKQLRWKFNLSLSSARDNPQNIDMYTALFSSHFIAILWHWQGQILPFLIGRHAVKGFSASLYYSHICEFSSWKKCSIINDSLGVQSVLWIWVCVKSQPDTAKSPRQVHAWKCSLNNLIPVLPGILVLNKDCIMKKHPSVFNSVFVSHMVCCRTQFDFPS